MNPSGHRVISFVKFPPVAVQDIQIDAYMRCLTRYYRREVEFGVHDDCSLAVLVELCQHIVNLTSTLIMEAIRPIVSHWHSKAPQVYAQVSSRQCFFGVDEADVVANMTTILPQCFGNTLHMGGDCGSLREFIHMVGREVAVRINSRIALILNSHMLPAQLLILDCNCICFTTLNTMIGLVSQVLRCQEYCVCTPLRKCSRTASSTSPLHAILAKEKLHRLLLQQGPCEVLYYTSNKDTQDVLSEITEFTRPVTDGKCTEDWVDWCDYSMLSTSLDSSGWTQTDGADGGSTMRSGADELRTDDSSRPSCQTFVITPYEGESSDSPAESQDTGSTEEAGRRKHFVPVVLAELLLLAMQMARRPLGQAHVVGVIQPLLEKAQREIQPADITIDSNSKAVKACMGLFRDLHSQFGSAKAILQAMTSRDPAAEDLIIQALKTHLSRPAAAPNNPVVRFLSSAGRVMTTAFTACFSRRHHTSDPSSHGGHCCPLIAG